MPKILYFDCFSGISGDMTIGALLDLGIDQKQFLEKLNRIGIGGFRVEITKKKVNNISATDFDVIIEKSPSEAIRHFPHRKLSDIVKIIKNSGLEDNAKSLGQEIFELIAVAEAKIHHKSIEEIHFHEVGAIDSIVDILGTSICISMLGVDRIIASPLHLGSGFVKCAHGVLPVPAPATSEILKGVPVYATGVEGELVTPTGAAIIKSLAAEFKPMPPMQIEKIGYGTGKRLYEIPNALRVFLGQTTEDASRFSQELVMLETNIDDMNPETYSYLVPLMLDHGALDVFLTNIIMKKGRPGVKLSVLVEPEDCQRLEEMMFTETTTLGVRKFSLERHCLERKIKTVDTSLGKVRVKQAYKNGKLLKTSPEYEDCRTIAEQKKIALPEVYAIIRQEISNRNP